MARDEPLITIASFPNGFEASVAIAELRRMNFKVVT
jgi:hypothetical protein